MNVTGAVRVLERIIPVMMIPTKRTAAAMRNFFIRGEKRGGVAPRVALVLESSEI